MKGGPVGEVRVLPGRDSGVDLAAAAAVFLDTITVANTRRGYAAAVDRMVRDLGGGGDVESLDPDQVAAWFTAAWGSAAPKTWNTRLNALSAATAYWRAQGWLTADVLVRLRFRPAPPARDRALTVRQVGQLLELPGVALREKVLRHLLYESAARVEEVLRLDVEELDLANRRAVVTRKGGAQDVITWRTGTARLLPRLLAGRRTGPAFLTDRKARPSVAASDVDESGRGRLSYRRAAELLTTDTAGLPGGPWTLHQLRHSALTHAAEDGASTEMLMALSGHVSVRSVGRYARVSAEALARWQAARDPAARRRTSTTDTKRRSS